MSELAHDGDLPLEDLLPRLGQESESGGDVHYYFPVEIEVRAVEAAAETAVADRDLYRLASGLDGLA